MIPELDQLLQNPAIWRGGQLPSAGRACLPTGHPRLDAQLPGGGWPVGAITEILVDGEGRGELTLLLSALAQPDCADRGILWVTPPFLPYAPALHNAGIPLAQCVLALPETLRDRLWVTEQTLRSGACGAVLAWLEEGSTRLNFAQVQRLQAAADAGKTAAFLFRPAGAETIASPALLRIRAGPDHAPDALVLHLIKRRGPPLAGPLQLPVRSPRWPRPVPVEPRRPPKQFVAGRILPLPTSGAKDIPQRSPQPAR